MDAKRYATPTDMEIAELVRRYLMCGPERREALMSLSGSSAFCQDREDRERHAAADVLRFGGV